jgi:hypothetical protein
MNERRALGWWQYWWQLSGDCSASGLKLIETGVAPRRLRHKNNFENALSVGLVRIALDRAHNP